MRIILVLLLTVLVWSISVTQSYAQSAVLPQNQVVNRDYFAAGNNVEINGTINGDLYAAGDQVIINGTINGDVIAAGNSVTVGGQVLHDVRTAGRQVSVTGRVGGNITAAGQNINLTNGATLAGSLVAAGQQISIATAVPKTVNVAASDVIVSAPVGGDVNAQVARLVVTGQGNIQGNVTHNSNAAVQVNPGATISGQVSQTTPIPHVQPENREQVQEGIRRWVARLAALTTLANGITLLVIGLLLLRFLPEFMKRMTSAIEDRTGWSLLIGFLVLFVTPLLLLLVMLTVIGIPLSIIGYLVYGLSVYLASIPVAYWLGQVISRAARWDISPYLTYIVGLVVLILLGLLPVVGGLMKFVVLILGLGGLYYSLFYQARTQPRGKLV